MHFVYILRSADKLHSYVGYTSDLRRRFAEHNQGLSIHTRKHTPWSLYAYCAFEDERCARGFEAYLKSHSGRAFAKRHFWSKANSAELEKQID